MHSSRTSKYNDVGFVVLAFVIKLHVEVRQEHPAAAQLVDYLRQRVQSARWKWYE